MCDMSWYKYIACFQYKYKLHSYDSDLQSTAVLKKTQESFSTLADVYLQQLGIFGWDKFLCGVRVR